MLPEAGEGPARRLGGEAEIVGDVGARHGETQRVAAPAVAPLAARKHQQEGRHRSCAVLRPSSIICSCATASSFDAIAAARRHRSALIL
jgi:hypothetical protein